MGRNGKKAPVFEAMVKFVNENIGATVSSKELLLGKTPDRGAETAYLYKFVKLGYIKPLNEGFVKDENTQFLIVKGFPPYYNSVTLGKELKIANGLIP